jgi:UDP-GlcNAc:undecaprenyl-phosphate GlcNAc-1-phosphate transferase
VLASFLVVLVAFMVSLFLTPLVRGAAIRFGVLDQPNARKVHHTPTPLLGGLAIYAAVVLPLLFFLRDVPSRDPGAWNEILAMIGGGTVLVIVGVWDDRGRVDSTIKLFLAMVISAVILAAGGVRVTAWVFVDLFKGDPILYLVVGFGLTLAWVVAITAAFSILDHMDGLCSGIAAMASLFFLILSVDNGQVLVSTLAAVMLGGTVGFLRWNLNAASIFMGGSGAMLIGFMMATLGIKLEFPQLPETQSWMIPVLILGIPIFDTALVMVSRLRRRLVPFTSPGKDHTAHRLANLGLTHRGVTLSLFGTGLFLGCLALLVAYRLSVGESYALIAVLALAAIVVIVILEKAPYQRQEKRPVSEIQEGFF